MKYIHFSVVNFPELIKVFGHCFLLFYCTFTHDRHVLTNVEALKTQEACFIKHHRTDHEIMFELIVAKGLQKCCVETNEFYIMTT